MTTCDGVCGHIRSKWDRPTIASWWFPVPRPSSVISSSSSSSSFSSCNNRVTFFGPVLPRYFIPSRRFTSSFSLIFAVPSSLYLIIEPAPSCRLSFSISLILTSFFIGLPFRLVLPILSCPSRLPPRPFLFPSSFLPFRCRVCFLFSSYLELFLSSSPFRTRLLALLASCTNYLCLISDTVDVKR